MSHGKALKALARKRLKVIYAVMRDRVPLRRLVEALRTDWSPSAERPGVSMSRFNLENSIAQLTKL